MNRMKFMRAEGKLKEYVKSTKRKREFDDQIPTICCQSMISLKYVSFLLWNFGSYICFNDMQLLDFR